MLKSGEGSRIRDLIVSFYVERATLSLRYIGEGKRGRAVQDRTEEALSLATDLLDKDNPHGDGPRWTQALEMVGFGRAARLGPMPGDAYHFDFPERGGLNEVEWGKRLHEWRKGGPIPVTWMALPAKTTFPASLGSVDDEGLSWKQVTWWELQEVFSAAEMADVGMPADQKDWQKSVTLIIHSNRKFVTYGIGDQGGINPMRRKTAKVLRSLEHRMGRSVIQITPGFVSAEQVPGKYWQSVLFPVRHLIKALDARLSEMSTSAHSDAFPMLKGWVHRNMSDNTGATADERKFFDGDIFWLDPGDDQGRGREDITGIFQPQFGEMTLRLIDFILDRIGSKTAATSSLEGAAGPAGEPAFSRNDRVLRAERRLIPLTTAMTRMDVRDGSGVMAAIAAFGEPVPLNLETGEYVLQPDSLKGWELQLKGTYRPNIPRAEGADMEHGMSLMERRRAMNASFPADSWIAEHFFNIDQYTIHERRTLEDDFGSSKRMRDLFMRTLEKEAEVAIAADEGMSLEEAIQRKDELSSEAFAAIIERATGGTGGGGGGNGATGNPLNRPAGGPTPQATLPRAR